MIFQTEINKYNTSNLYHKKH